jgi:hypothetical protein
MTRLDDLLVRDRRALSAIFDAGAPVQLGNLADRTFRGVTLGNPAWFERLTWKRFRKVFESGPQGLTGYNRAVARGPLTAPWDDLRVFGSPVRYGRFIVREVDGGALIDYGRAVDPLVAVDGDPGLILGVTELVGRTRRWRTPTWFALVPEPPTRA